MSGSLKRSLMQVDPTRLVELADSSEGILTAMRTDWNLALPDLSAACEALGDAKGTANIASSYADSLADAAETLGSLSDTLALGVAGLIDAARDAVKADDTVAGELDRAAHSVTLGAGGSHGGLGPRREGR